MTEEKSILLVPEQQKIDAPDYTPDEVEYLKRLQARLDSAKTAIDQVMEEFDNLPFNTYWYTIERTANTQLKPTKNKGDSTFQSGTLRTKMMSFLATYQALNLSPDISAFGEDEVEINNLGHAMEDIIDKTQEVENDEEWKMLRQYEMLKHGYVFVEDVWEEKYEVQKKVKQEFMGKKSGVSWTTDKVKLPGMPKRTLLPGPAVYLGDLTKYMIEDQPYIFTVEIKDYYETKAIYGDWEMWQYVTKDLKSFNGATDQRMTQNAWRLYTQNTKNKCEIIKYQDKPGKEFQTIINGVPMLPIGYPFPWGHGEYSITQQNLEPIRQNFAYGKSFIFKNKNVNELLDEMMRLAVLKTQGSFRPALLNLSDRVVSRDVMMPGNITRGIKQGQLVPVIDQQAQGVTVAEFNMIEEIIKFSDRNTVSQTTTGAQEQGSNVSATQIMQLQQQAKIMMGLTELAAALLEKKLGTKRLMILLENWFDPLDQTVDQARNVLKNKYRTVSRKRNISGKGNGMRMVIPTKDMATPDQIKQMEESFNKNTGVPLQMIMIDPDALKETKLTWIINVSAKAKKSSEYSKILFGAMLTDAKNLGLMPDQQWMEERFAEIWDEDAGKMFRKTNMAPPMVANATGPNPVPGGQPGSGPQPRVTNPPIKTPMPVAQGAPTGAPMK
jgi:hypothetical protein